MIFQSRAARRRNRVVSQAHMAADSMRQLSSIQLKLRWSKLKIRLDGLPAKRRAAAALEVMPEALALAREAGRRAVHLEAYPVQMLGAVVLADGLLAEMRTGEGKTLVAAIGAAVGTLFHDHVHVVTVNEYLAQRDAQTMGALFSQLGLTCGVVLSGQSPEEKRAAYACHVTYGVNSELGFDYLRDNMVSALGDKVQPPLSGVLAVIDEADAILIDEARTPLIITQESAESLDRLPAIARFVEQLTPADYELDERQRRVHYTDAGYAKAERWMLEQGWLDAEHQLYDTHGMRLLHRLEAALKARLLYRRDEQYIVTPDRKISIIDEGTGRTMADRRWSDGLHQAVEARENVPVLPESQTLASISYQHFFRLYGKRAGLTGTAWTEREEFETTYGLLVVRIPTHRRPQREDRTDVVYRTKREKYEAIVADIAARHSRGQPVLLGTPSVDVSEHLSRMLTARGIAHELLNARHHAREAEIVAQAGRPGAVTVATNMAGRGTDIVLGGNVEHALHEAGQLEDVAARRLRTEEISAQWHAQRELVLKNGGLYVIGAERHESRRIDNQLRGRSGRQGDPGESKFYLSLEDDLLRVFGSGLGKFVASQIGAGEALEHPMLARSIEAAQKRRENAGYNQRRELMKFDQVSAKQRDAIYAWRDSILAGDTGDTISGWLEGILEHVLETALPTDTFLEHLDPATVRDALHQLHWPVADSWVAEVLRHENVEAAREAVRIAWRGFMTLRLVRAIEATQNNLQLVLINAIDSAWRTQMVALDDAREGVHLQAYAQQDPTRAYMRLGGALFAEMCNTMRFELCSLLAAIDAHQAPAVESPAEVGPVPVIVADASGVHPLPDAERAGVYTVRRNALCACGSGRRFKHCHGRLAHPQEARAA